MLSLQYSNTRDMELIQFQEVHMDNKKVSRKEFLKIIGSFLLGIILIPLSKFENLFNKNKKTDIARRQAMFFKRSDHLAG